MTFQKWRGAAAGAATLVVLGAVVWFVGVPVSEWAVGPQGPDLSRVDRLAAVNNVRSGLLTGLSTVVGLVVAGFGVRRYFLDRDKQRLEEDKHLVGQFDAAWGRLASEDPVIRANALRTLFRLMTDSERDRPLVLRSVCDLLRQRSTNQDGAVQQGPDITAALDALRERRRRDEPDPLNLADIHLPAADLEGAGLRGARFGSKSVLISAKLSGSDLRDAVLTNANLTGADLRKAALGGATLDGATLTSAVLIGADAAGTLLAGASLRGADLSGADLRGADLRRAVLREAKLDQTTLTGADLTDADLIGTDLSTTIGLTREAVTAAVTDKATALPPALRG
ncbi:pentapeptide repeat-containing protein [Amycolatopsis sp. H20-H5]|uniref:pentapeptide repeat-containing protein n=1 Tax=Amycolatopsis sp. H20-H5 TaxID=3046309 RepID=UPI002DB95476|nr:pentapeptide repeat-containing protein [Amycolatopsis sp. H20-H5]MEC3975471.1 pentapeptide repeat-containing protein [Amycolatopsis sp. H20-H5]